jgi:hypothetical protein
MQFLVHELSWLGVLAWLGWHRSRAHGLRMVPESGSWWSRSRLRSLAAGTLAGGRKEAGDGRIDELLESSAKASNLLWMGGA